MIEFIRYSLEILIGPIATWVRWKNDSDAPIFILASLQDTLNSFLVIKIENAICTYTVYLKGHCSQAQEMLSYLIYLDKAQILGRRGADIVVGLKI